MVGGLSLLACVLAAAVWPGPVQAQCPVVINTFPHTEGFEAAAAWTSGGTENDWAWGVPAKATINSAGGGDRCWMIGGLTGSFYNYGQHSWLETPCFDFSGVAYPWVSFKVFWECERQYDGLGFQYSLDQGGTWTNVGEALGAAHCMNTNWYNTAYINNLTLANPRQGWSGRMGATQGSCMGGQGSAGWVTASHCLDHLAGEPLVKFRFVFGAGTTCNSYDGVAIDDFHLGEAPANEASFIHACADGAVDFLSTSALCPTSLAWDFGDPDSGAQNSAIGTAPSHTFSGPGVYPVSLTAQGPCNAPATVVQTIVVPGVTIAAEQPGCTGANGSLTAQVSYTNGPVSYLWMPGGQTTAQITGLAPGSYTVQVSAPGSCMVEATAILLPSTDQLQLTLEPAPVSCHGANDGSIQAQVNGGTGTITYTWTPALPGGAFVSGLPPGSYSLTATDAEGCSATATTTIVEPAPVVVVPPADTVLCAGASLLLVPDLIGGTAPLSVSFLPEGPLVQPTETGTYTITASDANGCSSLPVQVVVGVVHPERPVIAMGEPEGCAPHCVALNASGAANGQFQWDLGNGSAMAGASIVPCYITPGQYLATLTLTDVHGCVVHVDAPGTITVLPTPVAVFAANPPITTIGQPTVTFFAATEGVESWAWSFGGVDTLGGPVMQHTFTTVDCHAITLTVTNSIGCGHQAEGIYCVEEDFALYVPNAFTPDGDGLNDEFAVVTTVRDPAYFEMVVMDRWGSILFTSEDHRRGWDGTAGSLVPQGVYLWQVAIKDVTGHLHQASGHVTLLR